MSELVLYHDEEGTKPFIIEYIGKVDEGDTKIIEGYLKNEIELDIEQIYYESGSDEVYVENLPAELISGKVKQVSVVFKPKITKERKNGLNTFITFYGKKIIPAE